MTTRMKLPAAESVLAAGYLVATAGGLLLVLAPDFVGLGWLNASVRAAFFGTGTVPAGAEAMRRWLYAVEGSTLAAFGILGWSVVHGAIRRRVRWGRNALTIAVGVWFPLDTFVSLRAGVWANAVLNVVIALLLLGPLARLWNRFPSD